VFNTSLNKIILLDIQSTKSLMRVSDGFTDIAQTAVQRAEAGAAAPPHHTKKTLQLDVTDSSIPQQEQRVPCQTFDLHNHKKVNRGGLWALSS
jgi:hypothetical protein